MKLSSVSPLRCEVITPQPAALAMLTAAMLSEMEPVWFTCEEVRVRVRPIWFTWGEEGGRAA